MADIRQKLAEAAEEAADIAIEVARGVGVDESSHLRLKATEVILKAYVDVAKLPADKLAASPRKQSEAEQIEQMTAALRHPAPALAEAMRRAGVSH